MLSGKQLHGLAAKSWPDMRLLGTVLAPAFDGRRRFCGLYIERSGMIGKKLFVPLAAISHIDISGAYIADSTQLAACKKSAVQPGCIGCAALDAEGRELGSISDMLFEDKRLVAYVVSDGLLGDYRSGRRRYAPQQIQIRD
ncbi:MAG: hypothetical protein Q4B96_06170 [Bacillota bacterium]|nr:hypothetical protein [Bacillota bacterium]